MASYLAKPPQFAGIVDPDFRASSIAALISTVGSPTGIRDYSGLRQDAAYQSGWLPGVAYGPYGPVTPFDGAHYALTPGISLNGLQGTLAVVARIPTAWSGLQVFAGNSSITSGTVFRFAINAGRSIRLDIGTVAYFVPALSSTLDGTWATIVFRWDAGTQEVWVNGALQGLNTATTGFTPPAGDSLQVGYSTLGAAVNYSQPIDSLFLANRRWTDSQVRRWSSDPWWAFRPQRRRFAYAPAATATTRFRRKSSPSRVGTRSAA